MKPTFWQVVDMTTCGDPNEDKVGIMITLGFQYECQKGNKKI